MIKLRLLIKKCIFEKGTTHRWTKHIHTVVSTDGVLYLVSGRQLVYRKAELLKVDQSEQAPVMPNDADDAAPIAEEEPFEEEKQQVQRARRQQRIMNQEGVK